MSNRNIGWPKRPLGELFTRVIQPVRVEAKKTYREIGIRSHCKGIFHKPSIPGALLGDKRVFYVEPNCLVLNIVFAWEQAIAVTSDAERGMVASHRFPMYKPKADAILVEFARLYFSTPRGKHDLLLASPGGAGRNRTLSQGGFVKLTMPTPPRMEQVKIIEMLAAWNEALAANQRLVEAKKRLKRAFIQQLVERRGNMSMGGQWTRMKFSQIAELSREKCNAGNMKKGSRCVELEHVASDEGRLLGWAVPKKIDNSKKVVRVGDVLFGKLRPYLQKYYLADFDGACSSEIWVLRANNKICENEYLFCLVQSKNFLRAVNVSIGSKMPRADWGVVSELEVFLPPIDTQRKIARVICACDAEVASLITLADKIRIQQGGLMQQLVSGQIRL